MRKLGILLPTTLLLAMMLACGSYSPRPEGTRTPQPTREIEPTFTPVQLVAPTATDVPTVAPPPVLEPTATSEPVRAAPVVEVVTQVPTAVAAPMAAQANDVANLRSGPGTDYATVGNIAAGQALTLVGRNAAGDWYQLADGTWIASFLVTGAPADLPVVEAVPVVATDTPFIVATIAPPVAVCDCSGDNLNCDSFDSRNAAHACFDYCMATTGRDVHDLDHDGDGQFCESR